MHFLPDGDIWKEDVFWNTIRIDYQEKKILDTKAH